MSWIKLLHNGVKAFEPYGVILAVIGLLLTLLTYAAETNDRQAERIFKAWEIVNSDKNVGSSKRRAIEYLNMKWEGNLCGPPFSTMLRYVSPDPNQQCIFPRKEQEILFGVKAEEARLYGVKLRGAYLLGADLRFADLRGAYLGGADLSSADLRRADLRRADLRFADLGGADLSSADLRGADLRGADLRGADLRGADLSFAYLTKAKVTQDQLDSACQSPGSSPPKLPEGLTWHGRICERYKEKAE